MIINPNLDAENIFTEYPLLAEIAALFPDRDIVWHKYFRYLALCYEQDSPLMKKYPDIVHRKRFAADQVGYEGEHHADIAKLFVVRVIKSRLARELAVNEFLLEVYFEELLSPLSNALDDDKKLKAVMVKNAMREQIPTITAACEMLHSKICGSDEELEQIEDFDTSPESMARNISK